MFGFRVSKNPFKLIKSMSMLEDLNPGNPIVPKK